jgi:hypothetical protein
MNFNDGQEMLFQYHDSQAIRCDEFGGNDFGSAGR